jgi:hypothetical protein
VYSFRQTVEAQRQVTKGAPYFAAEKAADADALAQCFVEEGIVRDEAGTFKGKAAIQLLPTALRRRFGFSSARFRDPLPVRAQPPKTRMHAWS